MYSPSSAAYRTNCFWFHEGFPETFENYRCVPKRLASLDYVRMYSDTGNVTSISKYFHSYLHLCGKV